MGKVGGGGEGGKMMQVYFNFKNILKGYVLGKCSQLPFEPLGAFQSRNHKKMGKGG